MDTKPQGEKTEKKRKTPPTHTPPHRHGQVSCSFPISLFRVHQKDLQPVLSNIATGDLFCKVLPLTPLKTPLRPRKIFLTGEFERVYEFMLEVNFIISSLCKYQGIYFSYVISRESVMWPDFYSVGLLRDLTVSHPWWECTQGLIYDCKGT